MAFNEGSAGSLQCVSPAENLNLFAKSGTELRTCTNYLINGGIFTESCVSDLIFELMKPAKDVLTCITVELDDLYIINEIIFSGY